MNIKNCIFVICAVVATAVAGPMAAQQKDSTSSRLIIGGYGEAVYSRHFYSDDVHRYMYPANNKDAASHGRGGIDPIGDIAFALGFDEQGSFARFFKRETGMTPTEYRNR